MRANISDMVYKIGLWIREIIAAANRRLLIAMACYVALIGIALYALLPIRSQHDSFLLGTVLVVFALLIIKTLAHAEDE
jgi:hypothetical protein